MTRGKLRLSNSVYASRVRSFSALLSSRGSKHLVVGGGDEVPLRDDGIAQNGGRAYGIRRHLPAVYRLFCDRDNKILPATFWREIESAYIREAGSLDLAHVRSDHVDGLIAAHIDSTRVVDGDVPVTVV